MKFEKKHENQILARNHCFSSECEGRFFANSQLPGNFNGLRAICGKFLLGNYNQPKLMEKQVVETPLNPKA